MIVLAGALLGATYGAMVAIRRKGKALDIAQYAAGYGILFVIIALFLTIFIHRASL
ncbi:hypothetical protein [Lacimonas salitolerans]|uniref:PEP-CTERM protein-sorting domain-containing protein n=1 Tax=Lacimonas salitolerans TaxID=1323750 RepID=A0ABW4EIJ7_9RHOB